MKCFIPLTINSEQFCQASIPLMEKVGVPVEKLNLQDTCKLGQKIGMNVSDVYVPRSLSDLKFGVAETRLECQGSYLIDHCGYMNDPSLTAKNLFQAASGKFGGEKLNSPAEFIFGQKVQDFVLNSQKDGVTGLKLSSGDSISAPIILNASGSYSTLINDLVFKNTDLQLDNLVKNKILRQEVAVLPVEKTICNFESDFPYLGFDFDNGYAFKPELKSNKLVIGSGLPECDSLVYAEDDDSETLDYSLTEETDLLFKRNALRFLNLPLPTSRQTQGFVSTYDVAEDWTPIYDKSNLKGYYQAIATSGNQFKNAGIIGKIVEKIISDNENNRIDTDQTTSFLELENLGAPGEGDDKLRYLSLSHFSRLRDLSSGGNVLG